MPVTARPPATPTAPAGPCVGRSRRSCSAATRPASPLRGSRTPRPTRPKTSQSPTAGHVVGYQALRRGVRRRGRNPFPLDDLCTARSRTIVEVVGSDDGQVT